MPIEKIRALFEDDQVFAGASEQELKEVEAKLGIDLPDDTRSFYKLMNGSSCITDSENGQITFWPLSQLKTVSEEFPNEKRNNLSNAILFADHLIRSWAFAGVVVPCNRSVPAEFQVYVVGIGEVVEPIARTYSEFLELVLRDDCLLYGWRC